MFLTTRQTLESKVVYDETGRPRSILYVEDDPIAKDLNLSMMRVMGFAIDTVADAKSSMELASERKYDFIIFNIDSPATKGHDMARWVRANIGPSQHSKILAMTDNVADAASRPEWRYTFDGVMAKQVGRHDFRCILHDALLADRKVNDAERGVSLRPSNFQMIQAALARPVLASPILPHPVLPIPVLSQPVQEKSAPVGQNLVKRLHEPALPSKVWRNFSSGLPLEFSDIVAKLAVVQAHAFTVDIAKGFAAKNDLAVLTARRKLNSLADSFEMDEIIRVLNANIGTMIGPHTKLLFGALARWQNAHARIALAA